MFVRVFVNRLQNLIKYRTYVICLVVLLESFPLACAHINDRSNIRFRLIYNILIQFWTKCILCTTFYGWYCWIGVKRKRTDTHKPTHNEKNDEIENCKTFRIHGLILPDTKPFRSIRSPLCCRQSMCNSFPSALSHVFLNFLHQIYLTSLK